MPLDRRPNCRSTSPHTLVQSSHYWADASPPTCVANTTAQRLVEISALRLPTLARHRLKSGGQRPVIGQARQYHPFGTQAPTSEFSTGVPPQSNPMSRLSIGNLQGSALVSVVVVVELGRWFAGAPQSRGGVAQRVAPTSSLKARNQTRSGGTGGFVLWWWKPTMRRLCTKHRAGGTDPRWTHASPSGPPDFGGGAPRRAPERPTPPIERPVLLDRFSSRSVGEVQGRSADRRLEGPRRQRGRGEGRRRGHGTRLHRRRGRPGQDLPRAPRAVAGRRQVPAPRLRRP